MKKVKELSEEELIEIPMAMYIHAVSIINGTLPKKLHEKMEQLKNQNDPYAIGYFEFLNKKKSVWQRMLQKIQNTFPFTRLETHKEKKL